MSEEQLKELIAEMEARAVTFKMNVEKYMDTKKVQTFWKGKLSETEFVIEKLRAILNK
jgi:hypothetical protein